MMNKKMFIWSILLAGFMLACKYGEVFKTYQYLEKWEISYPPYLTKTNYVYPGAEFQAKNNYRDTYMFCRGMVFNNGAEYTLDSLSGLMDTILVDKNIVRDSSYTIDDVAFHTQFITGLFQDKKMFYVLSVFEYKHKLYHFSGWMFNTKRELWQADYEEALHSWTPLQ